MGRHSTFTAKTADAICSRMIEGESLQQICRDKGMPSRQAVLKWLNQRPDFVAQYARAREALIDYMGDEILDIADDASNDWMERLGEDEKSRGWRENGEAINRSRLRVDARKWLMSKIMPKKYGDHVSLQHSGTLTLEALVGASFKAPEKE